MEIKEDNILFLIGAGCSKDAGIKISDEMVTDVENLIKKDKKWIKHQELYYYLRSSIEYSEGIFGNFHKIFNIEKLLIVIAELKKKEKNLVFPFIGNWNNRLIDVAGKNFENLKELEELIYGKIFDWVNIKDLSKGTYYKGFGSFKNEIGKLIRIFSLNYDLLFERTLENNYDIELGFDPSDRTWQYANFEEDDKRDIHFYLYKLHGSIDWQKSKNKIMRCDSPIQNSEIIFGTDTKLKSVDPYLFYVFEFRKWTLSINCKLIITLGYSFSDEYINSLISQALSQLENRNLLIIRPFDNNEETIKNEIMQRLQLGDQSDQIELLNFSAKEFLEDKLNLTFLINYMPKDEDSPF